MENHRSESDNSLEVQAGVLLRQRGYKLVTAESCTGGLIGHLLTNIPGSSDYYLGGAVSYANEAKESLLGVQRQTLERYGAVSEQVVLEMARGARQMFSSRFPLAQLIGLSVSGVAGPGGGTPEKPVGLVWIGLCAEGYERAYPFHWQSSRVKNKELSAEKALELLVQFLNQEEGSR